MSICIVWVLLLNEYSYYYFNIFKFVYHRFFFKKDRNYCPQICSKKLTLGKITKIYRCTTFNSYLLPFYVFVFAFCMCVCFYILLRIFHLKVLVFKLFTIGIISIKRPYFRRILAFVVFQIFHVVHYFQTRFHKKYNASFDAPVYLV